MKQKLSVGSKAPSFSLMNHLGEKISLKNLLGKKVVLYFYPKALTPGCTVQACNLRDFKKELESLNVIILGVSADDERKLKRFQEKESLNFDLLSDSDQSVCKKYGVWQKKKNYGKEYMGIVRTTFIIDEKGKIINIMDKVNTKTHHQDLLELLK